MTPDGSMIPDEIAEILHERAGKLWTQWWEERKENPTFLQVIMDTPLNPGTRVVVESLSQKYMDCQPGDENYLQWSAALIDETVTPTSCEKLNIVLDTISGFQGTSAHESMAYLTFLYVAHIDMQRAAEREASILFTDRCEQYDDFGQTGFHSLPISGIIEVRRGIPHTGGAGHGFLRGRGYGRRPPA